MFARLTCDEAPEEPASVSTEQVLKIECNINITTNYMVPGILNVRRVVLYALELMILPPYIVFRPKAGEELAQSRPRSCVLTKITANKIAYLSHSTYGTLRMESGYWQEGKDNGK